jgi:hypothetical protein
MTAADTITPVVERMRAIDAALPREDGVAYFNRLYLRVTETVAGLVAASGFENAAFMSALDVRFAQLYFDAVDADAAGQPVPAAWAPLFEGRDRHGTLPVQFAVAGMNAHINHDLPLAVVSTCEELALAPEEGTAEHRDYTRTNHLLAQVQGQVKRWFEDGLIARIDDACGKVDDALEMWSIAEARAAAWHNARALWTLRNHPHARSAFLAALTATTGLAGRGILL